ncbi:hypothetical protein Ahy_B09g095254 isoform B [Arachis hypogaea]|uniref:Uncharacterized protein n=1 Tax=Arachis hypogaea TaxID=3818 RepID=A0A444XDB9_ARAHY|nr:hypothetical protein Ahy_B09g095254 isoform B [Arachis hypogaea]
MIVQLGRINNHLHSSIEEYYWYWHHPPLSSFKLPFPTNITAFNFRFYFSPSFLSVFHSFSHLLSLQTPTLSLASGEKQKVMKEVIVTCEGIVNIELAEF